MTIFVPEKRQEIGRGFRKSQILRGMSYHLRIFQKWYHIDNQQDEPYAYTKNPAFDIKK
jgi:hypothetical protein